MESIKNYLETMFKNLPQTPEVLKAKSELEQMMEDKYTELIREGKSENEAVGTVITEFGNLEELAESLGIAQIYKQNQTINRRKVSIDEVQNYLQIAKNKILMRSLGILLCICCVTGPVISDAFKMPDAFSAVLFFVIIAFGVALIILSNTGLEDWSFLKTEPCSLDQTTVNYVKERKREFTPTYSIMSSVGVILCITCVIPPALLGNSSIMVLSGLSAAFFFLFIGAGVFLLTYSKTLNRAYSKLIALNNKTEFPDEKKEVEYSNKTLKTIMNCYWETITCIYLCVSFITGAWHLTWLIWPIAGIARKIIINIVSEEGEE